MPLYLPQSSNWSHAVRDQEWNRVHLEWQNCRVDLQILHLCRGWRYSKTRRQNTADHSLQRHVPILRGHFCESDERRGFLQGSRDDRIRISWVTLQTILYFCAISSDTNLIFFRNFRNYHHLWWDRYWEQNGFSSFVLSVVMVAQSTARWDSPQLYSFTEVENFTASEGDGVR